MKEVKKGVNEDVFTTENENTDLFIIQLILNERNRVDDILTDAKT